MLVSEVMLQQTQVARVADTWPPFLARVPDPGRDGRSRAGRRDHGVGPPRLPAPGPPPLGSRGHDRDRRLARRPHRAAGRRSLHRRRDRRPGRRHRRSRGRGERPTGGRALRRADAQRARSRGRDGGRSRGRCVDATGCSRSWTSAPPLCRPRAPKCTECPLRRRCASRGPRPDEVRSRQPAFAGSFRQRRGQVMARLPRGRPGPGGRSSTPTRSRHSSPTGSRSCDGADAALP